MAAQTPSCQTVLLAEDNAGIRSTLAMVLRDAGYRVELAADGREALDLLRKESPPHLILLDLLMPVLDGLYFLQQIKALSHLASVPIIVTTSTNLTREWAEAQGCAGLLHKPIDPEALLQEVQRCVA